MNCTIEFNYKCEYNSSAIRDYCSSIYFPPIVTDFSVDITSSKATFTFNDTMTKSELANSDVTVEADGPNSPYTVSWSYSFSSDTKLDISYSISPQFIGGLSETITIDLSNVDKFKSVNMIPISNSIQYSYVYEEIPASATAEAAGAGASYTFLFTAGISIGVSLLTGGSMEQMWSLTNTLQIIYYLSLLNLFFPSNLLAILQYMSYSNFDNPITEFISSQVIAGFSIVSTPVSGQFGKVGFESSNILVNALDKILILLMMLILIIVFALLFK